MEEGSYHLTKNQKVAYVFAIPYWLVTQICQLYAREATQDIVRLIVSELISTFNCHGCRASLFGIAMKEMAMCSPCLEYEYYRIRYKKWTYGKISEYADFLVCERHPRHLCAMSSCFMCDYTICLNTHKKEVSSSEMTLYTYYGYYMSDEPYGYAGENEKRLKRCVNCRQKMCYACRLEHCPTAECNDDFPCDYKFLCPTCHLSKDLETLYS